VCAFTVSPDSSGKAFVARYEPPCMLPRYPLSSKRGSCRQRYMHSGSSLVAFVLSTNFEATMPAAEIGKVKTQKYDGGELELL